MPEVVRREIQQVGKFAAGAGTGVQYQPLPEDTKGGVVRAHAIQTINAPAEELYGIFRDLGHIPLWQEYVLAVTETSATRSHWVFGDPSAPDSGTFEFDSEIVEDKPGKRLAWRSVTKGFAEHGAVSFRPSPNGRGTEVLLEEYMPIPGGKLAVLFAAMFKRDPHQIVRENLRHLKQLAEAGEIPSVVGQPNGPRGFKGSLAAHLLGENNPTPVGFGGGLERAETKTQQQWSGGLGVTAAAFTALAISGAVMLFSSETKR